MTPRLTIDVHAHMLPAETIRLLARESPHVAPELIDDNGATIMRIGGKVVQRPMPREAYDLDLRLRDMDANAVRMQLVCATVHTFFYDQEAALGAEPPAGTLDIALYRDDLAEKGAAPVIGPTDIRFPVQGKTIVLVDDVLYTGRTVRAALDELVDFGRPRRVWLAVLVDRGGRELPIAADFAGARVEVPDDQDVQVRLREAGAPEDSVVVKPRRGT